jgi:hypothetical protein
MSGVQIACSKGICLRLTTGPTGSHSSAQPIGLGLVPANHRGLKGCDLAQHMACSHAHLKLPSKWGGRQRGVRPAAALNTRYRGLSGRTGTPRPFSQPVGLGRGIAARWARRPKGGALTPACATDSLSRCESQVISRSSSAVACPLNTYMTPPRARTEQKNAGRGAASESRRAWEPRRVSVPSGHSLGGERRFREEPFSGKRKALAYQIPSDNVGS